MLDTDFQDEKTTSYHFLGLFIKEQRGNRQFTPKSLCPLPGDGSCLGRGGDYGPQCPRENKIEHQFLKIVFTGTKNIVKN